MYSYWKQHMQNFQGSLITIVAYKIEHFPFLVNYCLLYLSSTGGITQSKSL